MKRYLTFCRLALEEQFPRAIYRRPLKALWYVAVFILGFGVSDYLGVPLKDIAEPAYQLLPAPWWALIALTVMVVSLLLVLNGARRLHGRTVKEVYRASEGFAQERAASIAKIELFTLYKGRFHGLYSLLHNRSWNDGCAGRPLSEEEIKYQESDFSNMLLDRFGDNYRTTYFKQLGEIPESARQQSDRMNRHADLMHQQIQEELGGQREIAQRANKQKEGALEGRAQLKGSTP